jgi:alginate O-acetyltransferase complex protein AlgI
MLFSSISFIYIFLPILIVCYYIAPKRLINNILLIASLIFYFSGEPIYIGLLIFSSLSDYLHSLYIEKNRGKKESKVALVSAITINLAMLGFFKYTDFFIKNYNGITANNIPLLQLALPIGISFYTFQTMSYTIDVYRGEVKAEKNFMTFATYVTLFPQLVAGPIVRYSTVAKELHTRIHSIGDIALGIRRFIIGLSKKVLIANSMGELCMAFRESSQLSIAFYWIYAVGFMLQIYFDFSGYSDMAIGLGKMFGFTFLENFNYPYISKSITEFWRRWHISLSTWFRDYVYIPLGGNRVTGSRWLRNILFVWVLTGFWHGAEWNFILWGLMFGILLILEKVLLNRLLNKLPGVIGWVYTMFVVMCSFVIFNAEGFVGAVTDLSGMFGGLPIPLWNEETLYQLRNYVVILLIAIVGATPLFKNIYIKLGSYKWGTVIIAVLEPFILIALLLGVTAYLIDGSFNPFLYFRF